MTLLSRTAESLYWMARYIERAEFTARILEASLHLAAVSHTHGGDHQWESSLEACSSTHAFFDKYTEANEKNVLAFMAFAPDNPSSILQCLKHARTNARAFRTALTTEMWETLNGAWLDTQNLKTESMNASDVARFLDWIKDLSLKLDGCTYRTMLRNDALWFMRLGTHIERADNTARIVDVKYHVLLPEGEVVGGGLDYYQWAAILRAVSALTAYQWVYHQPLKPWLIADLLILKDEMPRSLASCYYNIVRYLDDIAQNYGRQGPSQRFARHTHKDLKNASMEKIFQEGLHEFITDFIKANNQLGIAITEQYLQ